jgi:hypothetical protein
MRSQVALRNIAKDLITVQFAHNAYLRGRGDMGQDKGKADFLQHAVRHWVVGFRLANDTLQIEALVKVDRRQAKEARAVALTAQIGAPHVEMHTAEVARYDVLERGMSDSLTVNTPCEHKTGKTTMRRSGNHCLEVETELGCRRHTVDIQAHALSVSVGRACEVGDEAVQILRRERANAKLLGSSATKTHMMIQHWQGGTLWCKSVARFARMNILLQTKEEVETRFGKEATMAPNLLGMVGQGEESFGFLTDLSEGFDITVGFFNGKARYVAFKKRTDTPWGEGDLRTVLSQIGKYSNWSVKPASEFFDYAEKRKKGIVNATGWQVPRRRYAFICIPDVPGEIGIMPDKTAIDQKFPFS